MRIAVLGTGMVGRAVVGRLAGLGHEVTVGTRDVAATMARTEPDSMGNLPYPAWAAEQFPDVHLATHGEAAANAELLVNATAGAVSLTTLEAAGAQNLADKILIDIANPLDHSQGFPPSLSIQNTDSLAERIQAAFPRLRVVKTLITMNAHIMVDPRSLSDGDHSVFVSGNDADAKKVVTGILESFGHTDVIDLGDITTARGAEMMLPMWIRLMGVLGTPAFNFKIVR